MLFSSPLLHSVFYCCEALSSIHSHCDCLDKHIKYAELMFPNAQHLNLISFEQFSSPALRDIYFRVSVVVILNTHTLTLTHREVNQQPIGTFWHKSNIRCYLRFVNWFSMLCTHVSIGERQKPINIGRKGNRPIKQSNEMSIVSFHLNEGLHNRFH